MRAATAIAAGAALLDPTGAALVVHPTGVASRGRAQLSPPLRPAIPSHQSSASSSRSSLPSMSLTDETIDRIIEIVKIDAEIVADTAKQRPYAAWKLAQQSFDTRMPIFQWVVRYNIEKFQVKAYELAWNNSASLRNMAPAAAADLAWQRSRLEQRLHRHRRELRAALKALQPALEERLLEAAREDPKRIPGIGAGLLRSGWYRVSWNANKRMLRAFPERWKGRYEGIRDGLVRKWIDRAVDVHRELRPQWIVDAGAAWKGPETTAADIFQRQAASWMSPPQTLEPPRAALPPPRGGRRGGRTPEVVRRALAELRVALATTQGVLGIFVKTALWWTVFISVRSGWAVRSGINVFASRTARLLGFRQSKRNDEPNSAFAGGRVVEVGYPGTYPSPTSPSPRRYA